MKTELTRDETLHLLYRVMARIQQQPFAYGMAMLDALAPVMHAAENVAGGFYCLQDWTNKNL